MVGDQVAEHFGVGLRFERVAFLEEKPFDLRVILDDAVVDQRDLSVAAHVRMSVGIRYATVSRPARVTHAVRAREPASRRLFLEVGDASNFLGDFECAILQHGNAGGVVAAIFEALSGPR